MLTAKPSNNAPLRNRARQALRRLRAPQGRPHGRRRELHGPGRVPGAGDLRPGALPQDAAAARAGEQLAVRHEQPVAHLLRLRPARVPRKVLRRQRDEDRAVPPAAQVRVALRSRRGQAPDPDVRGGQHGQQGRQGPDPEEDARDRSR